MMDTPGNILRTEREKQKKSLKEVAKKLKINPDYLEAIENDNYSRLPAEVFTKAYIRLYAQEMGLDTVYVLDLFTSSREESTDKNIDRPKKKMSLAPLKKLHLPRIPLRLPRIKLRLPRLPWKPVLIISATILLLTALLYLKPVKQKPAGQPALQAEKKEQNKEPKKEKEKAQKIKEEPIIEEKDSNELHLKIIADEITWVSVSIDGATPGELLLRAGESKIIKAADSFALKIGNAGGTRLVFEGKDMGKLGPHGKVADIVLP
jgi:cytoskeletal protein RodZ